MIGLGKPFTVTALDPYGNPAPGVVVNVVVTGDNPQTANVTTGADGKATFSYSGTTMGDDTVVISATITTTVVTLDPIHVQWGRRSERRAPAARRRSTWCWWSTFRDRWCSMT